MRNLLSLPKAHLHLHLEGGMRPSTLDELAAEHGIAVPVIRGFGSFTVFADMYVAACEVLRSEDDLRRIVRECVEDAAAAGATWVEPSFYPPHHRERLGPDELTTEIVLDEGLKAGAELGVGFGLMVAADRTVTVGQAIELAHLAVRHADEGVVSFGLANDEVGCPPEPFAPAYDLIREAGLLSTPHAGELEGPASIWGALDALGADRIQHGVRCFEDPELVKRLADSDVCLDVCPTSNILLSVFSSMADHPLPALLDAGIEVSLNGDDPLLFGPGLAEEYDLCRSELGLSDGQLATIAASSLRASGAPRQLVVAGLQGIEEWLHS